MAWRVVSKSTAKSQIPKDLEIKVDCMNKKDPLQMATGFNKFFRSDC